MSIKDKYRVIPIKSHETYDWLLHKHYAKRIPSISYAFGLYGKKLEGILTIGKPASHSLCEGICGMAYANAVYELNRVCVNEGLEPNALSFFVARCLSYLNPIRHHIIVSYADEGQNHYGFIYQACNFLYTGRTKERTDIGNEDGTHSRHYSKNLDYKKNRKQRTAKHRYVFFVGNNRFRKKVKKTLKYKILPYPKGDNKRYDASYKPITQEIMF